MKKTLILGAVFFILAAVIFTCCAAPKGKIRPEALPENSIAELGTPESGTKRKTEDGAGKTPPAVWGGEEEGEDKEDGGETADGETGNIPDVRIREGYIRNKDLRWAAVYDNGEVLDALGRLGVQVATINGISVAQTNDCDCATTISIGGRLLSAYDFKEALGLKSTMITEIKRGDGEFTFIGFGEN